MVRLKVGDEHRPRRAAAPARRDPVHPQRPGVHPRHVPGPRRHPRDLPGLRGARGPDRVLRRRDRAADDAAPADRRGGHRGRRALRLPGHPLRRRARSGWSGRSRGIEAELAERLAELERQGKLLEAQRLRMRTTYDIEMMRQVGSCSGIENYSRHIDGRAPGSRAELPARLLPRGLPARHRRVPRRPCRRSAACTRATCPASAPWSTTASGCRARWTTGRCGGRSSSSGSARPSTCRRRPGTTSSAEVDGDVGRADHPADRPGRPRGRRQADQGPDRRPGRTRSATRAEQNERVLVTTLTKKMSEDLTDYLLEPASGSATCTPRSTPCAGSSCCASCGWASTTSWSASTCCARASTCPRCRWCRSSTPTRRASCAPARR